MSLVARGLVISGMLEEPPLECSDVEQAVRNRDPATACPEKQTGGKEELTGSRCCEGRYDSSLHSLGLRTMGSFPQDDCECHFASLQCGGASTDR